MRIGFVGLGKLGFPIAITIGQRGHDVLGYDVNPRAMSYDKYPHKEAGMNGKSMQWFINEEQIKFGTMEQVVSHSEIIFITVQTPHDPLYEGVTRVPEKRKDFSYDYLVEAVFDVDTMLREKRKECIVVVVSTVLPGTLREYVIPGISGFTQLVYNPLFIAMGTVMNDFIFPEFILMGSDDSVAMGRLRSFYTVTTSISHQICTTIENAELIKVAYNTFIGMKIVFANTMMEMCHKIPNTNVESVMNALRLAKERLVSPAYMSPGMGDGGACHPRDNIALSFLSQKLNLNFDLFSSIIEGRDKQTEFLADLMCEHDMPHVILGKAYKMDTNLTTGSPSLLLASILAERGCHAVTYDPELDTPITFDVPSVFMVTLPRHEFLTMEYPDGSVIIDPIGFMPKKMQGKTVIRVGRNPDAY